MIKSNLLLRITSCCILAGVLASCNGKANLSGTENKKSEETKDLIEENTPNEITNNDYCLVQFDTDGGSFISVQKVKIGEKVKKPNDPTKENCTFMGWFYEQTEWNFDDIVNDDLVLKAKWTDICYTVTFDSDGGSLVESQVVKKGNKVVKPSDPFRNSYSFAGWFIGNEEWHFSSGLVTSDMTLVAKWENIYYTVSFYTDGGTYIPDKQVLAGSSITAPFNPIKIGYRFVKWQLNAKDYLFGSSVNSNLILRAVYEVDDTQGGGSSSSSTTPTTTYYSVVFDSNGGSEVSSQTIAKGEKIIKPSNPTKENYNFMGWFIDDEEWHFTSGLVTSDMTLVAKWDNIHYLVTFDTDGGTEIATRQVILGGSVSKPGNPLKNGYKFKYWSLDGAEYNFSNSINSNITLKSIYEEDAILPSETVSYTITFDSDGGSSVSSQTIYDGCKIVKPGNPTKSGSNFIGWFIDDEEWHFSSGLVTSNMTLKAKWDNIHCLVTFDSDGGTDVNSKLVNLNSTVTKPGNPYKAGYKFLGWYLGETAFNFNTPITSNITLKAKYDVDSTSPVVVKHTVTFDSDGGSEVSSQEIVDGSKITKPSDPTKANYNFMGWYIGNEEWHFSYGLVTSDITLKAKWDDVHYLVSFNSNGGTDVASQQVSINGKANKPGSPYKKGYVFKYWKLNDTEYTFEETVTGNITLVAYYEEETSSDPEVVKYTVTFNSDGGSDVDSQEVVAGGKITKPNPPTKENSKFLGWFIDEEEWMFSYGIVTSNITLTAKWEDISFTVKFESDGGTYVPSAQVGKGQKVSLPSTNPYKDGYTFTAWYLDGSEFDFNSAINKDTTLVAHYTEVEEEEESGSSSGSSSSVGDDYTFVIKNQSDFDKWVSNESGNDYTDVAILSNTYTCNNSINLKNVGTSGDGIPTRSVTGLGKVNPKIVFTKTIDTSFTCLKYDTLPTDNNCFLKDVDIDFDINTAANDASVLFTAFENINNIESCKADIDLTGVGANISITSCFKNCTSVTKCQGDYKSNAGYAFESCTKLNNCLIDKMKINTFVSGTSLTGLFDFGFYNCSDIDHCYVDAGEEEISFRGNNCAGFKDCNNISCSSASMIIEASLLKYGATYAFEKCTYMSACRGYTKNAGCCSDTGGLDSCGACAIGACTVLNGCRGDYVSNGDDDCNSAIGYCERLVNCSASINNKNSKILSGSSTYGPGFLSCVYVSCCGPSATCSKYVFTSCYAGSKSGAQSVGDSANGGYNNVTNIKSPYVWVV